MNDNELHGRLIGRQGSRAGLNTPLPIVDIAGMAASARASGLALRPHAKTHKSSHIARMQLEAGICRAKISGAEAIADGGGVDRILITSPVVTPQAIERLIRLDARLGDSRRGRSSDNAAALAHALPGIRRLSPRDGCGGSPELPACTR